MKQQLRKDIAAKVRALPADYCREADEAICRHVLASELYRSARTVFCYVGTDREIDTTLLLQTALQDGKTVVLPLCTGKGIMEGRAIRSLDDLEEGKFGILAPGLHCPVVEPEKLDLAIVPCSTGNCKGQRLGYGGGFYDRYLPKTNCPTVLLCRGRLVTEDIPLEPHDTPMNYLTTEAGLVACCPGT